MEVAKFHAYLALLTIAEPCLGPVPIAPPISMVGFRRFRSGGGGIGCSGGWWWGGSGGLIAWGWRGGCSGGGCCGGSGDDFV